MSIGASTRYLARATGSSTLHHAERACGMRVRNARSNCVDARVLSAHELVDSRHKIELCFESVGMKGKDDRKLQLTEGLLQRGGVVGDEDDMVPSSSTAVPHPQLRHRHWVRDQQKKNRTPLGPPSDPYLTSRTYRSGTAL